MDMRLLQSVRTLYLPMHRFAAGMVHNSVQYQILLRVLPEYFAILPCAFHILAYLVDTHTLLIKEFIFSTQISTD